MTSRRIRTAGLGAVGLTAALLVPPAVVAEPAQGITWRDQEYWLEDYGVTEAWETTQGEGITIAVIDTGVDADHPGLEDAVIGGTDVSGGGDSEGSPVEQEYTEHGTLVASLAAGRGEDIEENEEEAEELAEFEELDELDDDEWDEWFDEYQESLEDTYGDDYDEIVDEEVLDEFYETRELPGMEELEEESDEDPDVPYAERPAGVVGVAPEAEILSISLVLEDPNPHGPGTEEQIAEAVTWAVDNGADIINMSIGSGVQDWPESWDEAFMHAEENDVLVVAAAGNRASGHFSVGAPATIPGVLTVAGVDEDRNISEDASSQGIAIDIAAASEPLVGALPEGGYANWNGTSGATPIVAGAAALVMAAHPELSAAEVKHRLLASADSTGASGVDPEYGHGVLNVDEAVNGSVPEFNAEDYETLENWIRVHRRAEDEEQPGHEDIPEDSGVVAGPDGEPREMPQASDIRTAQDWAGLVTVVAGGVLIVLLLSLATLHLLSRRNRS